MATRIKLRRDTATRWQNINPVLSLGEPGVETDTGKMKIGDGNKTWNLLDYFAGDAGVETDTGSWTFDTVTATTDGNIIVKAGSGADAWASLLSNNGANSFWVDDVGAHVTSNFVEGETTENYWTFGTDSTLTLPNAGSILDTAGSAGTTGILYSRTFQTPNNTNASNFGTNTIKLVLADEEGTQIADYIDQGIGVRVWFTIGDSYPITSCVQVSIGIWTITATGMGNRFATFTITNPLIFIYTGSTPNAYQNFPEYVPAGDGANITVSKGVHDWTFGADGILTFPDGTTHSGDTVVAPGVYDIQSIGNTLIQTSAYAGAKTWTFGTDGALVYPRNAVQRDTDTVECAGNTSTVVYTSLSNQQHTIKLLIQVEGYEAPETINWDTQACEMIVVKKFNGPTVAATVYAVVHTSVAPLATFSAQWNALTNRIEVLCATPSANSVYVRTFATEIRTAD